MKNSHESPKAPRRFKSKPSSRIENDFPSSSESFFNSNEDGTVNNYYQQHHHHHHHHYYDNKAEFQTYQKNQSPATGISSFEAYASYEADSGSEQSHEDFRSQTPNGNQDRESDSMEEAFKNFTPSQKMAHLRRLFMHCSDGIKQTLINDFNLSSFARITSDSIFCERPEIANQIFSLLEPQELSKLALVSKSWAMAIQNNFIWQSLCDREEWKVSASTAQKQLAKARYLDRRSQETKINWKTVFKERYRIKRNWSNGICNVRTFTGHTQGVTCVQFDDQLIASGSADCSIRIWRITTNTQCLMTLNGHTDTIRCLSLNKERLISGSGDASIKVWDLRNGECTMTLLGHTGMVRCLQNDNEKIVSGSYDTTLKIWDFQGNCTATLRGHTEPVLCVQFDEKRIISGSSDKTIKLWDPVTETCLRTLSGHLNAVTCLQFDNKKIISGSLDSNIRFWDINTGDCMETLDWMRNEGHTGVIRRLQFDNWLLVSAGDDKTLKIWDIKSGKRLATLQYHTDGVTCLQFDATRLVSGSYDKTVKLCDFAAV